ncbi:MAG: glycosyltransferase family 2 protein [Nitrososphaeria archaeon]
MVDNRMITNPGGKCSSKVKLSIIMPAYNVENKIVKTINEINNTIEKIIDNYEIIVVDDGSKDSTTKNLKSLKGNNIKIVYHKVNRGKGAAIKTGLKQAIGEYTMILDSDGEIKVKNIKEYLKISKKYDIIIASKRHPKSKYHAPVIRKILSIGYNIFTKLLLGINVSDTQTGLKIFKTESLKTIMKIATIKRYGWDTEVLVIANLLNLKIAEVPVEINQEKMFKFKDILKMLNEILSVAYRLRILRWYQRNLIIMKKTGL